MAQYTYSPDATTFKVFIGDTDYLGSYGTENTECYAGPQEGLGLCDGSGRYLIWELTSASYIKFSELRAFDLKDLAYAATVS